MLIVSHVWCRSTINDTEMDLTDLAADVRSFVQEYRRGQRDTKKLVSHEGLETRNHVSTEIQGTREAIENVGQNVGKLARSVDVRVSQAKRENLLKSLKYPGFNERRNEVREAHPKTFQWVFAGDDGTSAATNSEMSGVKWDSFSNWLKSTDTVYWINGKPGSGKSTMVNYILTYPQINTTRLCLDVWSPGCLLISHFFWRPGNPMQRNIKGLLCSLLYQLLENSEIALARVLALATGPSTKTEVTDWSLEELHSTLLSTVKAYDRPICMFVDGLDEVYPDQPATLLDMIMKLSIAGKVKMCLASRPEPLLQRRLYDMPHLQLQDLTTADLTQYVHDRIKESDFNHSWKYGNFVKSLVERAQGVFLWLVLVTRSVRNGIDNGDPIEIVQERVDQLKDGDLESLYKDMWDRASKDNPVTYRRTAALYFRIMLLYNREGNEHLHIYGKDLSVFTMMFATTDLAEKTLDAEPQTLDVVPEGMLLQGCEEVERIAKTYCFGLLEVCKENGDGKTHDSIVGWYGSNYNKMLAYAWDRKLAFVHRTAVDFLMDTTQGKEILSFDDTAESSHAFRIVAANLAHAQLFCDFRGEGEPSLASTHLESIGRVYKDSHESATTDYTRMMMHCKRLCDFEKIFAGPFRTIASVCGGVDFFKAVAMYSCDYLDVFEDQINALDKGTLSEILQILCDRFRDRDFDNTSPVLGANIEVKVLQFINRLMLEGADPNWNGTIALSLPVFDCKSHIGRQTPFVAFISRILMQAQMTYYGLDKNLSQDYYTKLLVTLQTFFHCGANLDEVATIFFYMDAQPSTAESPKPCQHLNYTPLLLGVVLSFGELQSSRNEYGYICLIPAHNVLNLVLSEWELLQSLSDAKQVLEDVTSSVTYMTSRDDRMYATVLGRLEITEPNISHRRRDYQKWRWCVAPQEKQDQISKELISLMALSGSSVDIFQRTPSTETQAIGYETLTSMLCGPHWVETKQHTRESFLNYMVEIGVLAEPSVVTRERHSIEDWLRIKGILDST